MLIAVIVLAVAVLLLGGGLLFLLKINHAQGETVTRLTTYATSTNEVVLEKLQEISLLNSKMADLDALISKKQSELDVAHEFIERLVVVAPDDVSLLKKKSDEDVVKDEKGEVSTTSTEKDHTE